LTEGTGSNPPYPEENPMAQVTYRGVQYDTDTHKAKQSQKVELTYRGVKSEKELATA